MRRGVVAHDVLSARLVHSRPDGHAHAHAALVNGAGVQEDVAGDVLGGVVHIRGKALGCQCAGVAHLSAALGIEGRFVEHEQRAVALACRLHTLAVLDDGDDGRFCFQVGVTDKLRLGDVGQIGVVADPCVRAGVLSGGTGALFLLDKQLVEALHIDLDALFTEDLTREVDREAKGVVQLERVLAADDLDVVALHQALQHFEALVDRLGEALLLHADHLGDEVLLLDQLGIRRAVLVDNGFADLIQERLLVAEQSAVTRSAAKQTAQHIALALVGGHDAVADHKGGGTDVVGDDTQRDVALFSCAVLHAGDAADVLHNVLHRVHEEEVIDLLHDAGKALQAHAGVDVGVLQGRVVALAVALELCEHEVPHLYKAVALTADMAVGLATALLGSAVKVDLGAGTAGTGAVLPEVVLLAEAHHMGGVNADLLCPDVICLVVVLIDGYIELVLGQLQNFCKEFPSPRGRLALEIIAEGEVAQHFKEGAVTRRDADALDIRRADTFLAGRHTLARRRDLSGEILFHGRHSAVDQQKAVVVLGYQRKAGKPQTSLRLKKREEFFA